MHYYVDLKMLAQDDMPLHQVWSNVFMQLHLSLVSIKDANNKVPIGVSFPEYVASKSTHRLGTKLRIFAHTEAELTQLSLAKWLDRLSDYVHISSTKAVPTTAHQQVIVRRVHPPASVDALARRYAKRSAAGKHGAQAVSSVDEARQRLQHYPDTLHQLAFIPLKSLSTGGDFNLVLRQATVDAVQAGLFSTYGLSDGATLPHW